MKTKLRNIYFISLLLGMQTLASSVSTAQTTIGLHPELGGYVFRLSKDGMHGLVAETTDQSNSSSWYNAQDIISNPANHSVAGQQFSDWRLPTKYELNAMYFKKNAIGGFAGGGYWSSTEKDSIYAWYSSFSGGKQYGGGKNAPGYVRAVRSF